MAGLTTTESPASVEVLQKHSQEQSQDANLSLMELEKGLRSGKVGEQCEAIVCVPALLEKYPFPIMVNSVLLKLADVFRAGSNFMKLCVLKALQSSKKHLNKILNVDEFARRFFTVIHSNDPIARAITLRVFGNISSIISEKKNIHHCIRNSLDSHDEMEIKAAIFATQCFAEQSGSFAESIWQKVATMVSGLSTPIEMKLKIIPIFRYLHHDIQISNQVHAICEDLLKSYPARSFVVTVLNTLTQLSCVTLIRIPHQVGVLTNYLLNDPRRAIRMAAANNLHHLAKRASQLWSPQNVQSLVQASLSCYHERLNRKILSAVCALSSRNPEIFKDESLAALDELTNSVDIEVASLALRSLVDVVASSSREAPVSVMEKLVTDVQMLLAMAISDHDMPPLVRCLASTSLILRRYEKFGLRLTSFLVESLPSLSGNALREVSQALVTMSSCSRDVLSGHTDFLLSFLADSLFDVVRCGDSNTAVGLVTLVLQSGFSRSASDKGTLQENLYACVSALVSNDQLWTLFKIGRQASRLAFPALAVRIFSALSSKVSSESLFFWLKALVNFHEGEAVLTTHAQSVAKLQEMLSTANQHYQEGLTNLKAAVTTDNPLYFQYKFARLRSDTLRACSQLLVCCSCLKVSPPPAMAAVASATTGQEVHQLSRLAGQFQQCAYMFSNVAKGYQNLYASSFNVDPTGLRSLQLMQETCQLLVYATESLVSQRASEKLSPNVTACTGKGQERQNHCLRVLTETNLAILEQVEATYKESKDSEISHLQINCLTAAVQRLLAIGFSYPLYFYKSLQNSSIQVAVSPSNDQPSDPCLVCHGTDLALQVEGVVVRKGKCFRRAERVNLVVKVQPGEDARNPSSEVKPMQPAETIIRESCSLRNDYFRAQFLLSFKQLGRHAVRISTGVTDEHGVNWETGPCTTVHVDVYEYGHYKKK